MKATLVMEHGKFNGVAYVGELKAEDVDTSHLEGWSLEHVEFSRSDEVIKLSTGEEVSTKDLCSILWYIYDYECADLGVVTQINDHYVDNETSEVILDNTDWRTKYDILNRYISTMEEIKEGYEIQ